MPRKKKEITPEFTEEVFLRVRITHPVTFENRNYLPGETATVPAEIAREWISTERARELAEDEK